MLGYIFKRILLIFPTIFFIILINFAIVQIAPGGPVENMLNQIRFGSVQEGADVSSTTGVGASESSYKASRGLEQELLDEITRLYGFDKPAHERFWNMLKNYATFDLGESYFRNNSVTNLIIDKLPVSISLGLWSTLLIYIVSIPLGIRKAVRNGEKYDTYTSLIIILAYGIPSFLFALILLVVFSGNGPLGIFPMRGLVSPDWNELSLIGKVLDYLWHIILPTIAIAISGFATVTMLTKNSFLEEINKQYVVTARAKGVTEDKILYGHVFRNAMLIIIAGIPDLLIKVLFTGSLLIEIIFSLDGLGLLGYESAIQRDYPVVFGSLFIFSLLGLVINLITDIMYVIIDPRINFEAQTS